MPVPMIHGPLRPPAIENHEIENQKGSPRTVRTVPPFAPHSPPLFSFANPLPPHHFHSARPRTVRTKAQVRP
jgi:hypothetical protein